MSLTRRTLLAAVPLAAVAPVLLSAALPGTAHAATTLAIRGADISSVLQSEKAGAVYKVGGKSIWLEWALANAGANWVRLRVWVNPPAGYSTLATTITLAKRAKAAGQKVLVDFHYSDWWADPGHQTIPAAWAGQNLATLAATVRTYTRDSLNALYNAGAPADMVQVGNEITTGMLWPLGKISVSGQPDNFAGFTTLLKAGIEGARAARGTPDVMIHIDRGGDNGRSRYFFDNIIANGVTFDYIGQSYYPFWHGNLATMEANIKDLTTRYGKPVVIAETAYPWTLANGDSLQNLIYSSSQLPDAATWPATTTGQTNYFTALRAALLRAGSPGFFTWEPGWIPGVGWEPGAGNPIDNLTSFDFTGNALPMLNTAYRP